MAKPMAQTERILVRVLKQDQDKGRQTANPAPEADPDRILSPQCISGEVLECSQPLSQH